MSLLDRYICSPHRSHFPDCTCSAKGQSTIIDGMDVLYVPRPNSEVIIIYCHGNKHNICSCTYLLEQFTDTDMVLFDYHGFGRSTDVDDQYSPDQLKADTIEIVRTVNRMHPEKSIVLYGHSLGGAVALSVLADPLCARLISGLILEGTFYKLSDILPLPKAMSWLFGISQKYPNEDYLEHLTEFGCPVLVCHSRDDTIIPFAQGEKIANVSYTNVCVLQGPHNRCVYTDEFKWRLHAFLEQITA